MLTNPFKKTRTVVAINYLKPITYHTFNESSKDNDSNRSTVLQQQRNRF